jgi:hypothetical protein
VGPRGVFEVTDPLQGISKKDNPHEIKKKNFSGTRENREGSRGCSPWDASPFGGERGSRSYSFNLSKKWISKEFLQSPEIFTPLQYPRFYLCP